MVENYGIVRLDKVRSSKVGHLHSVVYEDDILQNGMLGVLGDLLEGERELRELLLPEDTTKPLVLIAAPEIRYEQYTISDNALGRFYIKQGEPVRAYELEAQDIFSVSDPMITALNTGDGPQVKNYVISEAGSFKLIEAATVTGDEAFIGKIIDKQWIGTPTIVGQAGTISRMTQFIGIEVLKNRGY